VQGQAHEGNGDRRPVHDVLVQGEPREENGNRRECQPAADQPRGRAPTPPARATEPDKNRRTNECANADVDAPPLFWRASQNLAAVAMLLRGCPEPATSEERRVREQLKALLEAAAAQQVESSASRQHSERGWAGAPSAHGRTRLLLSNRDKGTESGLRRRRSRAVSGPTAMPGTPSRLANELRVSTTTTTTARTTTTIVGAGGTTTATTIASAAGHRTSRVRGLSAGAFVTRSSPRASGPQPTY
jgi:hypothetical protein